MLRAGFFFSLETETRMRDFGRYAWLLADFRIIVCTCLA